MTTMPCPSCRGTLVRAVGGGYYACSSEAVKGSIPPWITGGSPRPAFGPCGAWFEPEVVRRGDGCVLCSGQRPALARCMECRRTLCQMHSFVGHRLLCGACMREHRRLELERQADARNAQDAAFNRSVMAASGETELLALLRSGTGTLTRENGLTLWRRLARSGDFPPNHDVIVIEGGQPSWLRRTLWTETSRRPGWHTPDAVQRWRSDHYGHSHVYTTDLVLDADGNGFLCGGEPDLPRGASGERIVAVPTSSVLATSRVRRGYREEYRRVIVGARTLTPERAGDWNGVLGSDFAQALIAMLTIDQADRIGHKYGLGPTPLSGEPRRFR